MYIVLYRVFRNYWQCFTGGFYSKKQKEKVSMSIGSKNRRFRDTRQKCKYVIRVFFTGNKFYIIRAGTVTITKDGEGVVGSLKKGDCFGELALLKEDTRQATVKANAPGVECLSLTRRDFIKHFGELESWKDATVYNVRNDSIRSVVALEEYEDLNINDLKIKATIGVGGFGRVELVQHTKKKDQVFALKYLKKIDIVMQNQQEHVQNEKKIQMSSRSPFIVRMYKTYKDDKYIYFLMEACLGMYITSQSFPYTGLFTGSALGHFAP